MRGWKAITDGIWCISCRIIKEEISHYHVGAARDAKKMSRPILDVEVFNH
jgi:hypothetical protein